MELRHLRYLIAIAEHGSFSAAARRLYVAQSAISEQIADLEHELGFSLLKRSTRNTSLTPAGEVFIEKALAVLDMADEAIESGRRAARGETGSLRVGFFAGSVGENFTLLIRAFRKLHPGVRLSLIEMSPAQQWQALIDNRIDVGFSRNIEAALRSQLRTELVQQDPIMAILPKGHRAAPGPVDLRDLASDPFVLSSRETSPAVLDKVIELCAEAGFSPRIASISSAWSSVVLMVQAGEGIALLPFNQQQQRTRNVVFCPLKSKGAHVDLLMVWSPKRDSVLLKSFRNLIKTETIEAGKRL